jgi:hypothetical protein
MAGALVQFKGKVHRLSEASAPVRCSGLAVVELFKVGPMEMTVELQVAPSPDGPFFGTGEGNGSARAISPRNLSVVSPDGNPAPFYARLFVLDARSWATPVRYTLTTLEPPEEEAPALDPRQVMDVSRPEEVRHAISV